MYGVGHICACNGLNLALIISNHIDGRRRERTGFPAYLLFDRIITGFAELTVAVRIHTADDNSTNEFADLQLKGGRNGKLADQHGKGLVTNGDDNIQCRSIAHRLLLLDVQAMSLTVVFFLRFIIKNSEK